MNWFPGEILYIVKGSYKKNIIKVKNISANSEACFNCRFFFAECLIPNLIGVCSKRYFIEIKIWNV